MQQDLRKGLLAKKAGFEKMYEEGLIRVAKIRQKNDAFQKHLGGQDDQEDLRSEIVGQTHVIEKEIVDLKKLLNQMENKYRDPESKTKIKNLKADAQKQIERNKIILKDVIRASFERRSQGNQGEDNEQFVQGGAIDYDHLNGMNGNSNHKHPKKDSVMTDPLEEQQHEVQIDYEGERKMMLEKNAMMNEVEQATERIKGIIEEQAVMVNEQGQNLDLISDELMNTNRNMTQANEQLDQAATYQKKSKRKTILLVVIILVILFAAGGIVYFLVS